LHEIKVFIFNFLKNVFYPIQIKRLKKRKIEKKKIKIKKKE
jgi:hypothetical protein